MKLDLMIDSASKRKVKLLLERGAALSKEVWEFFRVIRSGNELLFLEKPALFGTVRAGNIGCLKWFHRRKGLNPNLEVSNQSLLCAALAHGRVKVAKFLVKLGGRLSWADRDGRTLMHYAARATAPHSVRYLNKAGLDVNAVDRNDETPLFEAVRYGSRDTIHGLLRAKAQLTLNARKVSPIDIARNRGFNDLEEEIMAHFEKKSIKPGISAFRKKNRLP